MKNMALMNLLRGEITQSIGKITGSKFKRTYYYKAKIVGKAPPTKAQTTAVRGYEVYLRILAAIYAELPTTGRYRPKGMSLLNWACKQSKVLLSQDAQYDGPGLYHAHYGASLTIISASYDAGRGNATITIDVPRSTLPDTLDTIAIWGYDATGKVLVSGTIARPNPVPNVITVPVPPGLDIHSLAWQLRNKLDLSIYSDAYIHYVIVVTSDTPPPVAGKERAKPALKNIGKSPRKRGKEKKNGKDEFAKSELGRESRADSGREMEG
jgi:hypothetical protein